jgi:hypothetical protein
VRKDILPYYRALGLSPGAEAIDIRRAYRQMIQQWHPDLFKAGSPMQTTAEDITKEINEAYEHLYRKKLYRNFLPKSEHKDEPAAAPDSPRKTRTPVSPKKRATAGRRSAPAFAPINLDKWKIVLKVRGPRWAGLAASTAVIASLAIFLGRAWIASVDFNAPVKNVSRPLAPSAAPIAAAHASRQSPGPAEEYRFSRGLPVPERFDAGGPLSLQTTVETDHSLIMDRAGALLDVIELGDSRARVRAVQGVPDEVSDTIYRYGSSVVNFRDGRVSSWQNRLPRLRVRDWSATVLPTLDRFALGSSRGDVVRAQGLPAAFDESTYTYGSSVVSFDRGQVSGWSEGDVRLQNFEMPTLPFIDIDRMPPWEGVSF